MNTNESIILVKGEFSPADAREILMSLIHDKINFHQQRNFSLQERFGKKDEHSEERILELQKSLLLVGDLVDQAKKSNCLLNINSAIHIEFTEEPAAVAL